MAPESGTAGSGLPFSRIIRPDDAGPARQGHVEATAGEREQLAALFGVETIASLAFDYAIDALPSQRYRLTGEVKGELTQLCGVTLEPVDERIREDVSLEYWPEHLIARADRDAAETEENLEHDPPEPLVGGKIDLGRIAAEIFAAAINPYPRKAGVSFDWTDAKAAAQAEAAKPFAALAKLKGKG
jgi:uncharacterized metal-binding protein YceD (DUF177 family)